MGWAQGNKKAAPTRDLYSRQWLPGVSGLLIHMQQTGGVHWKDDAVQVPQEFYNGEVPQWNGHSPEARVQMLFSPERLRDLMNYYHAKMMVKFDPAKYKGLKLAHEYYQ